MWEIEAINDSVRVGSMRGVGHVPVLVVPGRGDSLELRQGLGERLARVASRVVMVEHRGQGGSGRLGAHCDAVHIDSFDTHRADIDAALGLLDGPALVVAHSMGGLLAAHLLARHPDLFSSAAISSPMWRFTQPLALVRIASATSRWCGRSTSFASGEAPFDRDVCVAMRTSDLPGSATDDLDRFIAMYPGLVRGGSTWGWVAAAAASMAALDRAPLEAFTGPMVVASCTADRTVSLESHHTVARRLRRGRVVELQCGHDPFFAAEAETWWSEIEAPLTGAPV